MPETIASILKRHNFSPLSKDRQEANLRQEDSRIRGGSLMPETVDEMLERLDKLILITPLRSYGESETGNTQRGRWLEICDALCEIYPALAAAYRAQAETIRNFQDFTGPMNTALENCGKEIERQAERIAELEAALKRIAVEHVNYADPTVGDGQYGIGVVDGHRCAAMIAREALGDPVA